jgi:TRAP-type C4-dicarboxylate transport system permease small subunit
MSASKLDRYFWNFMLTLGSLAVLMMMCIIAFNIFGRVLFSAPILGAVEWAGLAGVVFAAVALPYSAKERNNVVVEIIAERFPTRVRAFIDAFTFFISFCGLGLLVYGSFKEAFYAASFNEQTIVTYTPTTPFKFIWAIGLTILCLVVLAHAARCLIKGVKG